MNTSAVFSGDREHRLSLKRVWDDSKPLIAFCMLNPSTADETKNDPTVERCQRRAMRMGYGGLIVVNIFSYRSTDPEELYMSESVSGVTLLSNDAAIMDAANKCKTFICGWGKHGRLYGRGAAVLRLLKRYGVTPMVLKINNDGTPAHPLYIGYNVKPFDFDLTKWSNSLKGEQCVKSATNTKKARSTAKKR